MIELIVFSQSSVLRRDKLIEVAALILGIVIVRLCRALYSMGRRKLTSCFTKDSDKTQK